MAYISYIILWKSESDIIVSKKDKVQDLNFNQLKLQVHDSYRKDETITTKFEAFNPEEVIGKVYLHEKKFKNRWTLINIKKRLQRI